MRVDQVMLTLTLLVVSAAFGGCGRDHAEGSAQKTTGHVESAVGSLTGDAKLQREGKKDEIIGGVKDTVGDVKETVHDATKK